MKEPNFQESKAAIAYLLLENELAQREERKIVKAQVNPTQTRIAEKKIILLEMAKETLMYE